jgi:hypothetical protein
MVNEVILESGVHYNEIMKINQSERSAGKAKCRQGVRGNQEPARGKKGLVPLQATRLI